MPPKQPGSDHEDHDGDAERGNGSSADHGTTDDSPTQPDAEATAPPAANAEIPVVGVGASAGGLSAFKQFLSHLPTDTGMAFVLIQHLDPTHESLLAELLKRRCPMPLQVIADGMILHPNQVYVIAPGQQVRLLHDQLHCMPAGDQTRPNHPIDLFLKSLAEDRGSKAIGVILSGTASDGTLGCCAIKEAGGITFAQDSESAEYDAMPANAVAAGHIDFVLPPADVARELGRLAQHPLLRPGTAPKAPDHGLAVAPEVLKKIHILLRSRVGHDFSYYKQNTVQRRIRRRMLLHKLDSGARYLQLLQHDPRELDALFQDILINVTAFFRDPESFEALKHIAFPSLLKDRPLDLPIRIWVPGCSTGQEVYSIAMALHECLGEQAAKTSVQIFGSDIDDDAIEKARAGLYPDGIEEELSAVRLKRYFRKVAGGYRVSKVLREQCIFAVQNVTSDPPFSRIDLVSCRNLLIYFEMVLQKKVLQLFHYALQPDGFLLLGSSETIGGEADLFRTIDKKAKLYQKKSVATRADGGAVFKVARTAPAVTPAKPASREVKVYDLERETERRLLERYTPAGVVIDPDQHILRFLGRVWPYIEHGPGAASLDLYRVAHPDLTLELRTIIHGVTVNGQDARNDNVRLRVDGNERRVAIQVLSLGGAIPEECNLMVLFEPVAAPAAAVKQDGADGQSAGAAGAQDALAARNAELERELADSRGYMQSVIEEQEGTNEALHAANEEVQSTNEELQSANEELETAKEELQSANEELATVNQELENRNEELAQTNNDFINLLISVNLPILILGSDLRIRQFTQPAQRLLNLIDSDTGRPVGNIRPNLEIPNLQKVALEVIDGMNTKELELKDKQGRWYSVRIRPYKTIDNRIDGVTIVFIDVDDVKRLERLQKALSEERRLATVVRDSNDAVTVQDLDGTIRAWNPAAERIYGYSEPEALGMNVRTLVPEQDRVRLDQLLLGIRAGAPQDPVLMRRIAKDGQVLQVMVSTSALVDESGRPIALATTERQCATPRAAGKTIAPDPSV